MKHYLFTAVALLVVVAGVVIISPSPSGEVPLAEGQESFLGSIRAAFASGGSQVLARVRAIRKPAALYYADRDGDGYGDRATKVVSTSKSPKAVLNSTDCNDANKVVFKAVQNLAPDCNLNGIPDDFSPTSVCTGNVERKSVRYEEGGATKIRAFDAYKDANNQYWVPLSKAPKNSAGRPLVDGGRTACPRS